MKLRTLAEVVAERRLRPNDCRSCKNFEAATDGLAYGWCDPHKQYVNLDNDLGTNKGNRIRIRVGAEGDDARDVGDRLGRKDDIIYVKVELDRKSVV